MEKHILERMVKDIKYLLTEMEGASEAIDTEGDREPLYLWDNQAGKVAYGKSYKEEQWL